MAFQGEWTSLKNIREGFIANVARVTLAFKIHKINLTAQPFLKSAAEGGSQPAPEQDPSLCSPCGRNKPREGARCVHPDVPRLLLSAPNRPEQIPAAHQRVSSWAGQNATINFYPGWWVGPQNSYFLHGPRSKVSAAPQARLCCTEVPGRARAAPTNSCTQVKIRILPRWDKSTP